MQNEKKVEKGNAISRHKQQKMEIYLCKTFSIILNKRFMGNVL